MAKRKIILKSQRIKKDKSRSKEKTTLNDTLTKQKTDNDCRIKQIESGKEQSTGRFAKGNQFWKIRSKCGRPPKFSSAKQLLHACEEYLKWVEDNPLYEHKIVGLSRGKPLIVRISRHRPMTIRGLCLFLDISQVTWWGYKKKSPDFFNICCGVEQIIWVQKFEGAVLGFFKPAIIARELGLRHHKDLRYGKNN